jgi:hypothetical protein
LGPITLFDKSFLQMLNTDEAVWFDRFFYPVICPLFYIETLADLWKTPREGKTAEEEVGIIASKTPEMHGGPCHFHRELYIQDLLGNHVPLSGQIPMAGMRRVVRDGKEGAIAEVTAEAKAFYRWQDGRFYEVERLHGRRWREDLERTDLSVLEKSMKQIGISSKSCKSLDSALKLADQLVLGLSKTPARFDAMLEMLAVPHDMRLHIKGRWKSKGRPILKSFSPYAAHVLRVELFFRVALGANLIASTRASHKVDMAYLFYLPFCTLFTSSDKLHRQCAPLFMRANQRFVWGLDLKSDLNALNTHYAGLSDEVKQQGIFKFATHLPFESNGLIRQLFESFAPRCLIAPTTRMQQSGEGKAAKEIWAQAEAWNAAPTAAEESDRPIEELESLIIKRSVRKNRGSWIQIASDD